jgi:hypothetical protein
MKSGVFEILKRGLSEFNAKLDEFVQQGKLEKWANQTARVVLRAFKIIIQGVQYFIAGLQILKATWNDIMLGITLQLMRFQEWQIKVFGNLSLIFPKLRETVKSMIDNYAGLREQAKGYSEESDKHIEKAADLLVGFDKLIAVIDEAINSTEKISKKTKDFTGNIGEPDGLGGELAKIKEKLKNTATLVGRDLSYALKYATTYLIRVKDYTGRVNREMEVARDNFRKFAEVLETDVTTAFNYFLNTLQLGLNLLFMTRGGPAFPFFVKIKNELTDLERFWRDINQQIEAEWIRGISNLITEFKSFRDTLRNLARNILRIFGDTIGMIVIEWVKGTIKMKQALESVKLALKALAGFVMIEWGKQLLSFLGILRDEADDEVDAILKKLDEAREKGEEVLETIRKISLAQSEAEEGIRRSEKTRQGTDLLEATRDYLRQFVEKIPSGLTAMIDFQQHPRMLMRLGRIARASIGMMISQGYTLFETLTALKEPLNMLREKYAAIGRAAPPALQPMLDMLTKMEERPKLFKGMSGLLDVFKAFVESGWMTQSLFKDLTAGAQGFVREILGVSGNLRKAIGDLNSLSKEQIMMLAPIITPFLEAAQKFGLKLPAWIEALAKKAGIKIAEQPIAKVPGLLTRIHDRIGKQATRIIVALQNATTRIEKALGAIPSAQGGLEMYTGNQTGLVRYHPREQVTITPQVNLSPSFAFEPQPIILNGRQIGLAMAPHIPKLSADGRLKMHERGMTNRR